MEIKYKRILNALIFLGAITAIVLDNQKNNWYYGLKPLTTLLVLLIPFLAKGVHSTFRRLLILALCFCLLGDVLLLKEDYFVFGLDSFLIAHLVFAKAFLGLQGFQKNIASAMVLLAIGIGLYTWLYPDLGALKYPVAAYVLVILFMAWQGIGLYIHKKTKGYGFIALGVGFFLFSDSMIAGDKFKAPFELSGVVILSTYWLAITLIANSAYRITK